ncbi:XS domain protein, partial [Trifolium medium]|nr:XS domain protein [Trifolium medium]
RRGEEDHAALSLSPKLRSHHRLDSGPDSFRRNRLDGLDRSPVLQRKLSPLKVDGVKRVSGGGNKRGVDGFEGRDSDWHLSSRRSVRV